MAYRTVLDTLFHALIRYAAPVLVFTAEEVWGTRYPDGWQRAFAGMAGGAGVRSGSRQVGCAARTAHVVTEAIEPLRREKVIGSSLEAEVTLSDIAGILGDYRRQNGRTVHHRRGPFAQGTERLPSPAPPTTSAAAAGGTCRM
jgi:isoleucyl-tRNA synthetase